MKYTPKILFTPKHNLLLHVQTDEKTFSVDLCFKSGCKDTLPGLAHLFEHCVFLGTATKSRLDIERALMQVGGDYNAFTGEDAVEFVCSGLTGSESQAMDILSDMAFNCTLDRNIEPEKEVVIAEISPEFNEKKQLIIPNDLCLQMLFGEGDFSIGGTEAQVACYGPDDLQFFKKKHVTKENCFVSVVSPLDTNQVAEIVDNYLGDQSHLVFRRRPTLLIPNKGIFSKYVQSSDSGDFDVAIHLGLKRSHDEPGKCLQKFACYCLTAGELSCLFGEARQKGLVYQLFSGITDIGGMATWGFLFGTANDFSKVEQTVDLIVNNIHDVIARGLHAEYFELFRKTYLFHLYESAQDPEWVAACSTDALAVDMMAPSFDERVAVIQKATVEDIQSALTEMIESDSRSIAVVGQLSERKMRGKMKYLGKQLGSL